MKYALLIFALLNVCSVSAQVFIERLDGKAIDTIILPNGVGGSLTISPGRIQDTIVFEGDIFGNYPGFQILPNPIITNNNRTPKRTVSGWAQHEQFRIKSYPVTHGKVLGWAMAAFSGAVDGVVEGYEFDGLKSFERKYSVQPVSFFGSESWKLAYPNNDPEQPIKPVWQVIGAPDFYHVADDVRKVGYISGGVVIGISGAKANTKWWHYAADFGISLAVSGAAKAVGMYWVRN